MGERRIRKVVVLANSGKKDVDGICARLTDHLSARGVSSQVIMLSSSVDDLNITVPDCDLALSLGGDGTVLTCAGLLKGRGIPVLA